MPFPSHPTHRLFSFLILVATTCLLASCGPSVQPIKLPPALTFIDLASGQIFETRNLKGKLILLNLWAAWSPASAKELPQVVELNDKYAGQGLITIGVSLDDAPPSGLLVFAERHGIRYPIVRAGDQTLDQLNPIETIPYTLLLNSEGKVLNRFRGPFKPSEVREAIEKNL